MKDQIRLSQLFRANTGKTTYRPKPEIINPYGYQRARVYRIETFRGKL